MNSIGTWLNDLNQKLSSAFGAGEASSISRILWEDYLRGKYQNKYALIDQNDLALLAPLTHRLMDGEPIQYIVRSAHFFGYNFYVDKHVLIPRRETEELVSWIIDDLQHEKKPRDILDIGTGSGIIPIILSLECPGHNLTAIDISDEAISISKKNANSLAAAVKFQLLDFLDRSTWSALSDYDIIVSNPPYIPRREYDLLGSSTRRFEPELALFTKDNLGLTFYEAISEYALLSSKSKIDIYLELNEFSANDCASIFRKKGFLTWLRKDMQGKLRMIKVRKEKN